MGRRKCQQPDTGTNANSKRSRCYFAATTVSERRFNLKEETKIGLTSGKSLSYYAYLERPSLLIGLGKDPVQHIKTGGHVKVDGSKGIIELTRGWDSKSNTLCEAGIVVMKKNRVTYGSPITGK